MDRLPALDMVDLPRYHWDEGNAEQRAHMSCYSLMNHVSSSLTYKALLLEIAYKEWQTMPYLG